MIMTYLQGSSLPCQVIVRQKNSDATSSLEPSPLSCETDEALLNHDLISHSPLRW